MSSGITASLEDLTEEIYEGLKADLQEFAGELWDEKKNKFKRFAEHAATLQFRVLRGERVDTAASALEDVLSVGLPMLRLELRYRVDKAAGNIILTAITSFFQGVLSIAIAAGKSYLESHGISLLSGLRDKLTTL